MKENMKIIILGNSPAALKVIEDIRQAQSEAEIMIFPFGNYLPYNRYLFSDFILKDIAPEEIFLQPESYYKDRNIALISDKKIARINFKKNRIFFETKEQLDYDFLIIAGTEANKFPDVKGVHKTGVYGGCHINDVQELFKQLPLWETIVVQSAGLAGLKLALALQKRGKEVLFISPSANFLSDVIDPASGTILGKLAEEQGLRVFLQNSIQEVLGDNDAKAIRLNSGKVLGCQAIIFADAAVDLRLFKDSDLSFAQRIAVNEYFQTNFANVFAVDSVCDCGQDYLWEEYESSLAFLKQQGEVVAAKILDQQKTWAWPLLQSSFAITEKKVQIIGETLPHEARQVFSALPEGTADLRKAFLQNEQLVGAIAVNHQGFAESAVRCITAKIPWSEISDPLIKDLCAENHPIHEELGTNSLEIPSIAAFEPTTRENPA